MTADRAPELKRDSGVPQNKIIPPAERGFESLGDFLKIPLAYGIVSAGSFAGLYDGLNIGLKVIGSLAERPFLSSTGDIDGKMIIAGGVVIITGWVYYAAGFVASFRVIDRFILPSAQRRFS